jgi:hypothetical protein
MTYTRLNQLGITVYDQPIPHVKPDELRAALAKVGLSESTFNEYFGAQTMLLCEGVGCPYPYDVEAVLEKMMSGKRTGTQLLWD